MSPASLICMLLLIAQFGFSVPASAYLDPGTGSMILQGVLATIAAGAAFFGTYWRRMRDFFGRKSSARDESGKS